MPELPPGAAWKVSREEAAARIAAGIRAQKRRVFFP